MTPDSWRRVEELFHEALEVEQDARSAFLQRKCEDDEALRSRVESLLRYHEASAQFLEGAPALGGVSVPDPEELLDQREREEAKALLGTRVGAYELVEVLGQGGMGTIFLGERADQEYEKRVAIKLIRYGLPSQELLHRFRSERQALALLEHPYITRLLDGGMTEEGRPYLVMELVDGIPIDRYCDERQLDTEERLELFVKVCSAVTYAHANLIVHRDLKPNNVLVTQDGTPKLLDFGVAKILESPRREPGTATQGGNFMTLRYASPEQLLGRPMTTATDVYSLGVVLYELLTGQRPYRPTTTPFELERAICEEDPERPSSFDHRLAGDIEAILLKALRKEPEERYASAEQLAQDVRHFLDGLPVSARKGTLRYRVGKMIRRQRLLFGLLAVLFLAISAGTIGVWVQSLRAQRERDLATAAEARARAAADLAQRRRAWMSFLFSREDPPDSGHVPLLEALEDVEGEILATTKGHPEERMRLMENLTDLYSSLVLHSRAADLQRQILEMRLANPETTALEIAAQRHELAKTLSGAGQPDAAYEQIELALEARQAALDRDDPRLADSRHWRGMILWSMGRYDEALEELEGTLKHRQRILAATDPDLVESHLGLGNVLIAMGRAAEAKQHYRKGLEIAERVYPGASAVTASAWAYLGGAQQALGDYEDARESYEKAVAMTRELYWDNHPVVLNLYTQLAVLFMDMGEYERAVELNRSVLDERTRLYPQGHWVLARTWWHQAQVLEAAGHLDEAEAAGTTALALYEQYFPDDPRETAQVVALLGRMYAARGDDEGAEASFKRALGDYRATIPDHRETAHVAGSLGQLYLEQGRVEEARPLLEESYRIYEAALGPDHPRTREARARFERATP